MFNSVKNVTGAVMLAVLGTTASAEETSAV